MSEENKGAAAEVTLPQEEEAKPRGLQIKINSEDMPEPQKKVSLQGANGQDAASMKGKRAVYLLQIPRDKLTEEQMRTLKCLILNIIRVTQLEHIIIEVHFN